MDYQGEERRDSHSLSEMDVEKIATAVAKKAREAFHIEDEKHYNDHQRLDRLLDSYETATNIIWKTILGLIIVGMVIIAGIGASKGIK